MQLLDNSNTKLDIMSYRAYKKVISSYAIYQALLFIKLVFLLVFMPVNAIFLAQKFDSITLFMIPLAIIAFLDLCWNLAFYCFVIKNQQLIIQICTHANHVVQQPDTHGIVSLRIYNAENQTQIDNQGLSPDLMKRYQTIMQTIIEQSFIVSVPGLQRSITYAKASTFLMFGLTFLMIFIAQPTTAEIIVLSIYQFLVFIELIKFFLIILIILLLPFILCTCCFYICCCVRPVSNNDSSQESLLVPPPTAANSQILASAQNTCPICYQNLQYGQQVIVLPCSQKHVFHQMCISTWLAVSPTCPQCRHRLRVAV